ncbi:MAG: hypothetical protein AAGF84_07440 [Planctomycetota bacterium]
MNAVSAINAFASDPFAAASAIKQAEVRQEVQTAVTVKQRDVAKAQGQAAIQLLDAAASVSKPSTGMPGYAPDKGLVVDYYA